MVYLGKTTKKNLTNDPTATGLPNSSPHLQADHGQYSSPTPIQEVMTRDPKTGKYESKRFELELLDRPSVPPSSPRKLQTASTSSSILVPQQVSTIAPPPNKVMGFDPKCVKQTKKHSDFREGTYKSSIDSLIKTLKPKDQNNLNEYLPGLHKSLYEPKKGTSSYSQYKQVIHHLQVAIIRNKNHEEIKNQLINKLVTALMTSSKPAEAMMAQGKLAVGEGNLGSELEAFLAAKNSFKKTKKSIVSILISKLFNDLGSPFLGAANLTKKNPQSYLGQFKIGNQEISINRGPNHFIGFWARLRLRLSSLTWNVGKIDPIYRQWVSINGNTNSNITLDVNLMSDNKAERGRTNSRNDFGNNENAATINFSMGSRFYNHLQTKQSNALSDLSTYQSEITTDQIKCLANITKEQITAAITDTEAKPNKLELGYFFSKKLTKNNVVKDALDKTTSGLEERAEATAKALNEILKENDPNLLSLIDAQTIKRRWRSKKEDQPSVIQSCRRRYLVTSQLDQFHADLLVNIIEGFNKEPQHDQGTQKAADQTPKPKISAAAIKCKDAMDRALTLLACLVSKYGDRQVDSQQRKAFRAFNIAITGVLKGQTPLSVLDRALRNILNAMVNAKIYQEPEKNKPYFTLVEAKKSTADTGTPSLVPTEA